MSTELIAIISVGGALAGLFMTAVGLMLTIHHNLRKEMRDEFKTQRKITTSLLERTARVEGLLESLRELFSGRRATFAETVAETPEQYGPR